MKPVQITLGLVIALASPALAACDAHIAFTVQNETDQPLLAWLLYEDCSVVVGKRGEYHYEDMIEPNGRLEVSDITGTNPPEPSCVQVATMDRRLLVSDAYASGGSYTVTDATPQGAFIPEEDDLPRQSVRERIGEAWEASPLTVILGLAVVLGVVVALGYAVWFNVRYFYGRRRPT